MTIRIILAGIAILLGIVVLQNALNIERDKRVLQVISPVVCTVYMIAAAVAVVRLYEKIYALASIIPFVSDAGSSAVILSNLLMMMGFIIIKIVKRVILNIKSKKAADIFMISIAETWYEYDEYYEKWFLRNRWVNFRGFTAAVTAGAVIAAGAFLAITVYRGSTSVFWFLAFPGAVVMILNEFRAFVDGITKEEFEHIIYGDDADARRVGRYYKLREILEKLLPDPLLSSYTGYEFVNSKSPADYVEKLQESDDFRDRITGKFFAANNRYMEADLDQINATVDLMHRRNVVMLDPFYRDLGLYVTMPMTSALLRGKKVTVITGRMSSADDVQEWLSELLKSYSHIDSLWRVKKLGKNKTNTEVGIISFPQFYDTDVVSGNLEFFAETDFVLMIEPSLILNTGQVTLSILAEQMAANGEEPVYLICDRNAEGIVDTLSHLLHTEITDVVAPAVPRTIYTGLCWDADGDFSRQRFLDKQVKYLGNGTEIAAIAVKNQIPEVTWYGETKVPLKDIRWLAGQYYPTLCKYMNIPAQQEVFYDKIKFESTLWGGEKGKEKFLVVEDEFCNMFSTMHTYLARGENQSFVNILSENYLLRDYMRCNTQMFLSDPDAVGTIVPAYSRTERNTLIKLILLMTYRYVRREEILNELKLAGIDTNDAFGALSKLLARYTFADSSVLQIRKREDVSSLSAVDMVEEYTISPAAFEEFFADSLKKAYYVLEEERIENSYIDAKLFNHVAQTVLPGQFVTYQGKYYYVSHMSPEGGVILRRAADHFSSREYYRQIRSYEFPEQEAPEVISSRKVMDMDIEKYRADFTVYTTGYLQMEKNHDLRTARKIDFSQDPSVDKYTRKYHNKTVLRIRLPEADDKICFTLCLLLQETFRSVFPDGWPYLAVVAKRPDDIAGMLNYMVYPISGEVEEGCIYFLEDSDMDLGLLEAVERNLMHFMEIIADYLDWHFEKMREPAVADPVPISINNEELKKEKEKRGLFSRFMMRIKRLFKGKKEEPVVFKSPEEVENTPAKEPEENAPAEAVAPAAKAPAEPAAKTPEAQPATKAPAVETEENAPAAKPEENITVAEQEENSHAEIDAPAADELEEPVSDEPAEPAEKPAEETAEPAETAVAAAVEESKEADVVPASDGIETEPAEQAVYTAPAAEPAEQAVYAAPAAEPAVSAEPATQSSSSEPYPEIAYADGTDIFDESDTPDPEHDDLIELQFISQGLLPPEKTRYQKDCYLKFGFEEIDDRLRLDDLMRYLRVRGWTNSDLTKARKRDVLAVQDLDIKAENTCDFCGLPLSGVSYEVLNDGRIRCNDCSSNAITNAEELKKLFYQILDLMESFYGVRYRVPISVGMTDARTIGKHTGILFVPSTGMAPRVLGFAQKLKDNKYNLLIENGSPRLAASATMVHELTHIWQYLNWDDAAVASACEMGDKKLSALARDILYEGMAMWSEIQYLYQIGETYYATKQEAMAEARSDIYGIGFILFRDQYPLCKDGSLLKFTPFASFPPIDMDKVKALLIQLLKQ